MTDLNLRAARIQLYGLMTAVLVAIVIAIGITTGAFVLSFSVLKDLAAQGMLPAEHAWIFPAIVDGGILGATVAVVVLSKISGGATGRNFFLCLLIAVVFVSVAGNAYHAYRAAHEAAAVIAGGMDLGFTPLAPEIAPLIAVIPPLLVLAFTHGIGILIKAIGTAYAEYNQLVSSVAALTDATDETAVSQGATSIAEPADAFPSAPEARATQGWVGATTFPESAPSVPGTPVESWATDDDALQGIAPVAPGIAPGAPPAPGVARENASTLAFASVAAAAATATEDTAASHAFEQTTESLLNFIAQLPLPPEVQKTARLKIVNPDLTFAAIAEQTGGVAASTALRRYKKAEEAALKAGFTNPPLPEIGEGALNHDLVGSRELVTS